MTSDAIETPAAGGVSDPSQWILPDSVVRDVKTVWVDILQEPSANVSIDDDFMRNGDSVGLLTLVSRLQEQFNIELSFDKLLAEDITIRSLAQFITLADPNAGMPDET